MSAVDPAGQTVKPATTIHGMDRASDHRWEFSLSARRELTRGISVNGGYFRRWFSNFLVTDNLSVQASDFDPSRDAD
jgi:hypothetical protein